MVSDDDLTAENLLRSERVLQNVQIEAEYVLAEKFGTSIPQISRRSMMTSKTLVP